MFLDITATFKITSESVTAQEMKVTSGLDTAETHERGDLISARSNSHFYQQAILKLVSRSSRSVKIVDHIEDILSRVEPHSNGILKLSKECQVEMWIKLSAEKSNMGFEIPADILARIAKLNVDLIFDIYGLEGE